MIKQTIKSTLAALGIRKTYHSDDPDQNPHQVAKALIEGNHENDNQHPSIIHFSFNKSATQYVKLILRRCAMANGMIQVGIHDYAFSTDFPFLNKLSAEEMEQYQHIFKKKGYLYSVFGGMVEGIRDLEQYKIVLLTRDPRDILVSEYFSMAFSHKIPKEGEKHDRYSSKRSQALESTIDEYVIDESDRVLEGYNRYDHLLLDKYSNVHVTSYERMVTDFTGWLNDLIQYCELPISDDIMQIILKENEAKKPKKEDVNKHIRKGQPGDYKEKLKPETIDVLTDKFSGVLSRYYGE